MKKCISCGAELDNIDKFCGECGAKQPEAKRFCIECGAELKPTAKFCIMCGNPVAQVPAEASANHVDSNQAKAPVSHPAVIMNNDVEVSMPDENTITIIIKGIPFNMKLVKGREYGTEYEILDFYLGETPVTQGLWMAVMGSNPSEDNGELTYPVTNLDYSLVSAFLIKLHKLTGFKFELPVREQWKYAYKGGAESKGYKFSGSDTRSEIGWGDDKMHPVGELYPNELGLYDMEGLVDELAKRKRIVRSSLKLGQNVKPELTGVRLLANINIDETEKETNNPLLSLINERKQKLIQLRNEAIEWYKENPEEKKKIEKIQNERNKQNGFIEGLCRYVVDDKFGFVKPDGSVFIEPQYDRAHAFKEGLAFVKTNKKCGFFAPNGKFAIEPQFDDGCSFSDGLAAVKSNGGWGFIDKKGDWVISPEYDDAWPFSDGLAIVEKKGKRGYIDKTGKIVIPLKYEFALPFKNGVAEVRLKDDSPSIKLNTKGEILKNYQSPKKPEHEKLEGLFAKDDDKSKKMGFVGEDGQWVIEPEFLWASNFREGLGRVEIIDEEDVHFIDRADILEL